MWLIIESIHLKKPLENFTSEAGCIKICSQKYYYSSFPSVEDMTKLREREVDQGNDRFLEAEAFLDAVEHCQKLNTSICKLCACPMRNNSRDLQNFLRPYFRFAWKFWWCCCRVWAEKFNETNIYYLDGFWTSRFYEIQVKFSSKMHIKY